MLFLCFRRQRCPSATHPCQHNITIEYENGVIEKNLADAQTIIKLHAENGIPIPEHFNYLKTHEYCSKYFSNTQKEKLSTALHLIKRLNQIHS